MKNALMAHLPNRITVLFTSDDTVKLADFGLGKALAPAESETFSFVGASFSDNGSILD